MTWRQLPYSATPFRRRSEPACQFLSVLGSKPRVVIDMPDLSLRICPFLLEQRSELWRGELQDRIWCAGIKGIVLGVEGACPICGLRAISGSWPALISANTAKSSFIRSPKREQDKPR